MFILKHIEIQDFMSIQDLSLDFDAKGIVCITGENGSGKSALFNAIGLALLEHRIGESYRDCIKTGCDEAYIYIEAEFQGYPIVYDVTITCNKWSGSGILKRKISYKGQEYVNSEYSDFIKEYELESLESIMFQFQGDSSIIDARPADRAALLKKLFHYDFSDITNKISSQIEIDKFNQAEIEGQLKTLKARSFNTQPLSREVSPAQMESWEQSYKDIDNDLKSISQVDIDSLNECDAQIASLQKRIEDEERKKKLVDKKAQDTSKHLEDLTQVLQSYDAQKVLEEKQSLEKRLEDASQEQEHKKELYEGRISDKRLLEYSLKELDDQIAICKTGICHACGNKIEPSHVQDLKYKRQGKEQELQALDAAIQDLKYDPYFSIGKELEKQLVEKKKLISDMNIAQNTSVLVRGQLEEAQARAKEIQSTCNLLYDQLHISLEKQSELKSLEPVVKQKQELIKKKQDLENKIFQAKEIIARNRERRNANILIEKDKDACSTQISELSSQSNEVLLSIQKERASLDVFNNSLPTFILLQACKQLEKTINSFVQKIFPYMRVSLQQQRSGVTFMYTAESSENEYISARMASGAQRAVLTLAYKLALARLYGVKMLCLDEIDSSCTDENASIVYDAISQLDAFDQIFLISHRKDTMRNIASKAPNVSAYYVHSGIYDVVENPKEFF